MENIYKQEHSESTVPPPIPNTTNTIPESRRLSGSVPKCNLQFFVLFPENFTKSVYNGSIYFANKQTNTEHIANLI